MKIEEGISNSTILAIVALCAAPAATLNIWPRVSQMAAEGISGNQVGIVLLVTVSALGMAAVPFAMKKAENWGFWLTCLAFGVGLAILNYTMAVGAVGKVRDGEADENRRKQAVHAELKRSLAEAERARKDFPSFSPTTPEMVETGKMAVALAIQARDQECKIVGDICRARVAQLSTRQSELAALIKDQTLTERARLLDGNIREARNRLEQAGSVPQHTDAQASRLAGVVVKFIELGPDAAERVADWIISLLALAAEAIGLGLPRVLVTAIAPRPALRAEALVALPDNGPQGTAPPAVAAQKPPAQNATNATAPRAVPKRTSASRPPALVSTWKADGEICKHVGKRVNCWAAYLAYKDWADARRQTPVDFSTFCVDVAIMANETPAKASSFFLDSEIPVKLKVVKA